MRTARRIVQVLSVVLMAWLFLQATFPLDARMPVNFPFRLSALDALTGMIVARGWLPIFLPAVIVLASTLLLGRFFCGWICPLGALIDLTDRVAGRRHAGSASSRLFWKYYLLAAIVAAAVGGLTFGWLLDPIGIAFRSALALFPPFLRLWQGLSGLFPALLAWPLAPTANVVFVGSLALLACLATVLALERIERRFWCRSLCPLGALLALAGRTSMLRPVSGNACNDCGRCSRACRMGALPADRRDFIAPECTYCFACVEECARKDLRFRLHPPDLHGLKVSWQRFLKPGRPRPGDTGPGGMSRRGFATSVAIGAGFAMLGQSEATTRLRSARLLRPPAALPEADFNAVCIRCGECLKVCPTNGLQFTLFEAGIGGLLTPRLLPQLGYCEGPCDMCARVCPTGAIRPFLAAEKPRIFLGLAVVHRDKCIAWRDGLKCLVCDEHCYYKAVFWKEVDGFNRPFVDRNKCVGCGICENKCPTAPDPAIVVYATAERGAAGGEGNSPPPPR